MSKATHLECSLCHRRREAGRIANLCECGGPLLARYDLETIRRHWRRREVGHGPASMWRYAPVLPPAPESVTSLGEGWTPLVRTRRLGARVGAESVWVKDEGINPTASYKARGLACAISMCVELGIRKVAVPSAGNAASALAAYAAAAGIAARVFVPRDVPQVNYLGCRACGADVTLVDGPIGDCGRLCAEFCAAEGWFDMAALKEPYRLEGKKTMGYEVAEQMDWELPDAILYPTGGGIGLIGMWRAFDEMEKLGWIGSRRPRMIAVQAEGCQPLVRAFQENEPRSRYWEDAHTVAAGTARPPAAGRLSGARGGPRQPWRGSGGERPGSPGRGRRAGLRRGNPSLPGRRGMRGRSRKTVAFRLSGGRRPHCALQHRIGAEIPGSLRDALSANRRRRTGQTRRPDHAQMSDHPF